MTTSRDTIPRITAHLGTPEYEEQFRRQSLAAAQAALKMWIVRIPCGILAAYLPFAIVDAWVCGTQGWLSLLTGTLYLLLATFELASIAFFGRSTWLRFHDALSTPANRRGKSRP